MKSYASKRDIEEMSKEPSLEYAVGKTFLFTGASGYIMRMMIFALYEYKERNGSGVQKIIALVRNREKGENIFADYKDRDDFELLVQDVDEEIEYDGKLDYIVHGASLVNPLDYVHRPVETLKPNIVGTVQLLELALRISCRNFIYISTSSVYGKMVDEKCQEDKCGIINFFDYKNSYSEGKRAGEIICNAYCHEYGLAVKVVRPFYVYGSGMSLDDGRLFADFVPKTVRKENIILKSDGKRSRNFIYITDAVRDIFCCMFRGKAGETYNIGNKEGTVTIMEFAQTLMEISGSLGKIVIQQTEASIPSNRVDVIPSMDKTEELVDRKDAYIGLKDGLLRLLASIESRG